MIPKKIVLGNCYRLRSSPDYGYVRPVKVIKPGTYEMKELAKREDVEPFRYVVVECEHVINKNDTHGLVRYFRPVDILEEPAKKT